MTTPTWTPSADLSTFAVPRGYQQGRFRVYFYDLLTRKEITDCPLNGMAWDGTGGMVSHEGRFVDGTTTHVTGAAWIAGAWRVVKATCESFEGRKVCVKVWHPEHGTDWRVLATGDGSFVKGKPARVGREWIESFKRGEVA